MYLTVLFTLLLTLVSVNAFTQNWGYPRDNYDSEVFRKNGISERTEISREGYHNGEDTLDYEHEIIKYNREGKIVSKLVNLSSEGTNWYRKEYFYNEKGELIKTQANGVTGGETYYYYDNKGRLIKYCVTLERKRGNLFDLEQCHCLKWQRRRVVLETNCTGDTINYLIHNKKESFKYDSLDVLHDVFFNGFAASWIWGDREIRYHYDRDNQMIRSVSSWDGVETRELRVIYEDGLIEYSVGIESDGDTVSYSRYVYEKFNY